MKITVEFEFKRGDYWAVGRDERFWLCSEAVQALFPSKPLGDRIELTLSATALSSYYEPPIVAFVVVNETLYAVSTTEPMAYMPSFAWNFLTEHGFDLNKAYYLYVEVLDEA